MQRVERPVERREAEQRARPTTAARGRGCARRERSAAAAAMPSTNESWYPSNVADCIQTNGETATTDRGDRGDRRRAEQLPAERVRRDHAGGREQRPQRQRRAHDAARRGDQRGPDGLVLEHDAIVTETREERPEERVVRGRATT